MSGTLCNDFGLTLCERPTPALIESERGSGVEQREKLGEVQLKDLGVRKGEKSCIAEGENPFSLGVVDTGVQKLEFDGETAGEVFIFKSFLKVLLMLELGLLGELSRTLMGKTDR